MLNIKDRIIRHNTSEASLYLDDDYNDEQIDAQISIKHDAIEISY